VITLMTLSYTLPLKCTSANVISFEASSASLSCNLKQIVIT
jgi:hypothetical protein